MAFFSIDRLLIPHGLMRQLLYRSRAGKHLMQGLCARPFISSGKGIIM
jgi:hypothetical protein